MSRTLMALLAPLLAMAEAPAVQYAISTFAGSNFVGDGGLATGALLLQPEGVTADPAGNLYVCDAADHRIRRILPTGLIVTVAGDGSAGFTGDDGPASQARVNAPYGIAADRHGNLYFADLGNARVRKIRPDGVIVTVAGGGKTVPDSAVPVPALEAKLNAPRNVAVDHDGNIFVSDFNAHRVYVVTPAGHLVVFAGAGVSGYDGDNGIAPQGKLAYPAGLAADAFGNVFIADSGNKKIRRVTKGIITTLPLPGQTLETPTGLALDKPGNLYVADGRETAIRVSPAGEIASIALGGRDIAIDATDLPVVVYKRTVRRIVAGKPVLAAGSFAMLAAGDGGHALGARLNAPVGLAFANSAVLVGDSHNRRIRSVDSNGTIRTVAADLDYSPYVAVDSSGAIYVSEPAAHRIRRIAPGGAITMFAGNGTAGYAGDGWRATQALLNSPTALAFDRNDNLYIADTGNGVIRKITADGLISRVAGGGSSPEDGLALGVKLAAPAGVALDREGNLYLSEADGGRVRKLTAGKLTTIAQGLAEPRGLRVDSTGDVFVAETGGNRIRRITSSGDVLSIAGTGTAGFEGDGGPAREATLNGPSDLVFSSDGSILVSDTRNNRVRRLTALPAAITPPPTPPESQPPAPIEAPKIEELTILHGATLQDRPVAIGQFVSIFGFNVGPAAAVSGSLRADGTLDREIGGTKVIFDNAPAPLFYVSPAQINAQVPNAVFGRNEVEVSVVRDGQTRGRGKVRIRTTAPGILTRESGTGQAAALNQDGSVNSVDNPAERGSIVTLFATGDGALGFEDGRPAEARPTLKFTVVHIEGRPAEILYAGRAPGLIGIMQLNVRVPADVPLTGGQRVLLHIDGEISQPGVYIQVR